jgi:putative transposase
VDGSGTGGWTAAVDLRVAGRADPEGPRGRAHHQRALPDRDRGGYGRAPGGPRVGVTSAGDGAGWLAFLRGLVARGLSGVALVTSDDHAGLVNAIAAVLPGAARQRCRVHYHRNLLTKVPKTAQPWVSTLVRTIFEQPDATSVRTQHAQVVQAPEARLPAAAAHLDAARDDILAFTAFRGVWRQVWSNNPQERLNKEIRRRTDVVGIFPGRDAIIRLVGVVLAGQDDE